MNKDMTLLLLAWLLHGIAFVCFWLMVFRVLSLWWLLYCPILSILAGIISGSFDDWQDIFHERGKPWKTGDQEIEEKLARERERERERNS